MLLNKLRAKKLMDQHGIDALIGTTLENVIYLSGHDGWVQRVYRTRQNFAVLSQQPDFVTDVVLNLGDITYFAARGGDVDRAYGYGGQTALVVPDGYTPANEEERRYLDLYECAGHMANPLDALVELIEERGLAEARIGFDEEGCSPLIRPALEDRFPKAEFVSAASLLLMIRAVKTDAELALLRRAAEINRDAVDALIAAMRPGVTETELAEVWRTHVAQPGGMWHWLHFGTGPRSVFVFPPTDRKLEAGDLFFIDAGLFYQGYNADGGACGSIGEPPAGAIRDFEAITAGIQAALDIVREGVTGGALYQAMVETIRGSGFPEFNTNFAGHTIGLEAREVPFIFAPEVAYNDPFLPPTSEMPLPAGSVINLEAPIGRMGHGGYQYETSVIVTPHGHRPLLEHDPSFRFVTA